MSERLARNEMVVFVCEGSDCKKRGSKAIRKAAKKLLEERGWEERAILLRTKCTGNCKRGPICGVQPQNVWLTEATPERLCERIAAIIDEVEAGGEGG